MPLAALGCGRGRLFGNGEAKYEDSAAFGQVTTGDMALMVLDNSISDAQAQSHAFANWFGGVERVKDSLWIANARAGVGKFQHQLIAFRPDGHGQGSAAHFFQGVGRVADNFGAALKESG